MKKEDKKQFRVIGRMMAEEIPAEKLKEVSGGMTWGTVTWPEGVVDVGP